MCQYYCVVIIMSFTGTRLYLYMYKIILAHKADKLPVQLYNCTYVGVCYDVGVRFARVRYSLKRTVES